MIITIDGPAGVGKGTLSQNLVKSYNFKYLDTGTLFRAIGLCLLNDKTVTEDNLKEKAIYYAKNLDFEFTFDFKCILFKEDVSIKIRSAEAGEYASKVGVIAEVRTLLEKYQKTFAQKYKSNGVILDGRDCGRNVIPEAEVKLFLDCPAEIRAQRRLLQLKELNINSDYDSLLNKIIQRDKQDRERTINPMKPAEDAIFMDTSKYSIEEMTNKVSEYINQFI